MVGAVGAVGRLGQSALHCHSSSPRSRPHLGGCPDRGRTHTNRQPAPITHAAAVHVAVAEYMSRCLCCPQAARERAERDLSRLETVSARFQPHSHYNERAVRLCTATVRLSSMAHVCSTCAAAGCLLLLPIQCSVIVRQSVSHLWPPALVYVCM